MVPLCDDLPTRRDFVKYAGTVLISGAVTGLGVYGWLAEEKPTTCRPAPTSSMLWAPQFQGSGSFPFIPDQEATMYYLFNDEQVTFIVSPIRLVSGQLPSGVTLPTGDSHR